MAQTTRILSSGTNVRLIASAGTGKTFNLALRTICILLSGNPPESVLCLTFTKKATAEMEERIMRILSLLAAGRVADADGSIEDEADAVAATLGLDRDGLFAKAAHVYPKLLADLSRLSIRTIDAFVNHILSLFPFEANLRPDFTIADEEELETHMGQARALALADIRATEDGAAALSVMTGRLGMTPMAVSGWFETAAEVFNAVAVEAGETVMHLVTGGWGRVASLASSAADAADAAVLAAHRLGSALEAACTNKNHAKACANLLDAADIDRVLNVAPFKAGEKNSGWLKGIDYPAPADAAYRDAGAAIEAYCTLHAEMMERAGALFTIRMRTHADELKRRAGVLSFADLTERAFRLLVEGSLAGDADYLYFRLDGHITHILVDEFQDTSVLQWDILKPLADEAMAGRGTNDEEGSFFFVGDPKQTLYRFRGGERALFDVVNDTFPGKIETHHLGTNFRSSASVVSFVDDVFKRLNTSYPNLDYTEQQAKREHDGFVRITHAATDDERFDAAEAAVFESRRAGYAFSDMAVLVNTNKQAQTVAEKLGAADVPVVMESSRRLVTAPAVRALIAALSFAVHDDDFDLVHFLAATPAEINLAELSPPLVEKFRARHTHLASIAKSADGGLSLVTRIAEATGIAARFAGDANLARAFDVAASTISDIDNPRLALAEFARAAGSTGRAPGGFEDAVVIMTIHKSKGLEFPVVIAPLLNDPLSLNAATSRLIVTRTPGTAHVSSIRFTPSKDRLKWYPEAYRDAVEEERERTITDGLNLLYVCLTRARDALFIAADENGRKDDAPPTPESLVVDVVGCPYERGVLAPEEKKTEDAKPAVPERPALRPEPLPPRPDIEAAPEPENFHAETVGRALHEAVYLMNEFTETDALRAAQRACVMHGAFLSDADVKRIEADAVRLVTHERFINITGLGPVFREQRFMHEGRQFVIDLFVVADDVVHLVDFKTGRLTEEKKAEYARQLELYAEILTARYGKPVASELAVFDGSTLTFIPVGR